MSKNKRGITLIALVITIIVLLILAGITINLTIGQDGILKTADQAGRNYEQAYDDEQKQLASLGNDVNGILNGEISQNPDSSNSSSGGTSNGGSSGNGTSNGETSNGGSSSNGTSGGDSSDDEVTTRNTYSKGDEVAIGTERFFVMEDCSETDTTVKLVAKYSLNKDGTKQTAITEEIGEFAFSTSNYWKDEKKTNELNLNECEAVKNDTGSTVYIANTYAKLIGGSSAVGRLLTYDEYGGLDRDIRYAHYMVNNDFVYSLPYWIATSSNGTEVYYTSGGDEWYGIYTQNNTIRPVVIISKNLVTPVIEPKLKEVTVGTESFYVLIETDTTVTLLAKYNLNTQGTKQENTGTNAVAFSSENYWEGDSLDDLNDLETSSDSDAIAKARSYAKTVGGSSATGRLLTYQEVQKLYANGYNTALWGTYAQKGYLSYWVSGTYDGDNVYYVDGHREGFFYEDDNTYYNFDDYGVRPVITISKSLVN